MRKITRLAIDAFLSATPFKQSNTEVVVGINLTDLIYMAITLQQLIALLVKYTSLIAAGQTNVTKERLNGIPGVSISQKNFQWFLNGVLWDGSIVKI